MKKIFDAVSARVEGGGPPLDQDGCRLVPSDLHCLQNLVSDSLLSSGNYSNIELVGSVTLGTASSLCGPQRLKQSFSARYLFFSINFQEPGNDAASNSHKDGEMPHRDGPVQVQRVHCPTKRRESPVKK